MMHNAMWFALFLAISFAAQRLYGRMTINTLRLTVRSVAEISKGMSLVVLGMMLVELSVYLSTVASAWIAYPAQIIGLVFVLCGAILVVNAAIKWMFPGEQYGNGEYNKEETGEHHIQENGDH